MWFDPNWRGFDYCTAKCYLFPCSLINSVTVAYPSPLVVSQSAVNELVVVKMQWVLPCYIQKRLTCWLSVESPRIDFEETKCEEKFLLVFS